MKTRSTVLIVFLLLTHTCETQVESKTVEMIVFIHGTIKPPEISFSTLYKIMHDAVDGTILSLSTAHVRKNPFFYHGHPIQEIGLHPIIIIPHVDNERPTRTAQTIADLYDFQYSFQNLAAKKLYYTFGWSGLLSSRKRYEAAEELYRELQAEVQRLQEKHIIPKITLITYSHGGNVALDLPRVHSNQEKEGAIFEPLSIESFIMLACPIQKANDYLVEHPLFKKVYNIFSTEDFVQQWDLFSTQNQFFSQRMFQDRKGFIVPKKVVQIRVRATKKVHGISSQKVEHDINSLLSLPNRCFEHRDPGHMEIGAFSWGNYWYRDIFPLFPLPVIALIPSIITTIERLFSTSRSITFDFIPKYNSAIIRDNISKEKKLKVLWTPSERIRLWDKLSANIPLDYTIYNQQTHIAEALRKAYDTSLRTKNGRKYRYPHNKTLARLLDQTKPSLLQRIIQNNRYHARTPYRFNHNNNHIT